MKRIWPLGLIAAAAMAAAPAHAEQGDLLVRLRGIVVAPNESSGSIGPSFPGEKVKVNDAVMPELDFTYMFTKHVGAELILATTKHHVSGRSGTTGSIGRLASSWVLPPTLTLQYHILPDGPIRPYVGAGVNYTIFYSEKASGALEDAVGKSKVGLKDSVGYALQAGVDVPVGKRTFVNFDVKYIDIRTKATIDTAALGTERVRVHLDPLVFGMGFGMRF
ncbi:OmpW/AlkL family protein [Flavisphingomonas formosensis]|uniref:OmpW/AlkL family protein n=1 Tax=Flavisphingomonas formosensis TaxID=861534 RepID=UPI0012F73AAF|nr:OmpW family protein [Sphingomonas formosensis]